MANCLIAYPNRVNELTLSDGVWSETLPLDNLKTKFIGEVARSDDLTLASTKFTGTFATPRMIRIIALINHTLSAGDNATPTPLAGAQYKLTINGNLVIDWTDVWQAMIPTVANQWEFDNFWSGKPTNEDLEGSRWSLPIVLDAPILCTSFVLELKDEDNPAGYVDIGRLFISDDWQPTRNMSFGNTIGYETETGIQTAYSGTEHFDVKMPARITTFSLDHMETDEGLAHAFDMQRKLGVSGEVFYMGDADDTQHILRKSFLGRMRKLSPLENPYFNNTKMAFEIKEII